MISYALALSWHQVREKSHSNGFKQTKIIIHAMKRQEVLGLNEVWSKYSLRPPISPPSWSVLPSVGFTCRVCVKERWLPTAPSLCSPNLSLIGNRTSLPKQSDISLGCELQWLGLVCKFFPNLFMVATGMSCSSWWGLCDLPSPGNKDGVSTCQSKWTKVERMDESSEGEKKIKSSITRKRRNY